MTERRRGYVKGPCPVCHQGDRHEKDSICHSCRQLYTAAKRLVAAHNAQAIEGWFSYGSQAHWNPGYYSANMDSASHDRLRAAVHGLIMAAATALYSFEYASREPDGQVLMKRHEPPLIERPRGLHDGESNLDAVLIRIAVAEAVNELDLAIVDALASTEMTALEKGSDLLRSLARGEITADSLNTEVAETVKHLRNVRAKSREPITKKSQKRKDR